MKDCNWSRGWLQIKEHCKMITIDLSKQHALDGKVIQQINFTGNLD